MCWTKLAYNQFFIFYFIFNFQEQCNKYKQTKQNKKEKERKKNTYMGRVLKRKEKA